MGRLKPRHSLNLDSRFRGNDNGRDRNYKGEGGTAKVGARMKPVIHVCLSHIFVVIPVPAFARINSGGYPEFFFS